VEGLPRLLHGALQQRERREVTVGKAKYC
jgi:hypothetical protein